MSMKNPITVSPAAIAYFKQIIRSNPEYLGIQLGVKSTGCSALSYLITPLLETTESDLNFNLEDVPFSIDAKSLMYLKDMHIDCIQDGLSAHLSFINPNATGGCGCGESFTTE